MPIDPEQANPAKIKYKLTALYPPSISVAFSSPNSCKLLAARELVYPSLQNTITLTSHRFPHGKLSCAEEVGSRRHSRTLRSMQRAPLILPSACAWRGGRMSMRTDGGDNGGEEFKMWCTVTGERRWR